MEVNVKTYATFRKYSPPDTPMGESFKVNVDKETVLGVIEKLGIPLEKGVILMVNSNRITDLNLKLNAEDVVVIFPLLGGG